MESVLLDAAGHRSGRGWCLNDLQFGSDQTMEVSGMTTLEAVARYYDAWQNKLGDFSEVPLADDFRFIGPVASFESAEGYRTMARDAGQAVTSFRVRRQFVDGNTVCSIIDWEMAIAGLGKLTSAEVLEVADGTIVRGELIYDAEGICAIRTRPSRMHTG